MNNIKIDTTVDAELTLTVNPIIDAPTGNAGLNIRRNGVTKFFVNCGDTFSIFGRSAGNQLIMYDTYTTANTPIRGVTPVSTSDLTRKDYVDDNFVDLTTAQDIAGTKTFTSPPTFQGPSNPYVVIDAVLGNPHLQFEENGVDKGRIYTSVANEHMAFVKYDNNVAGIKFLLNNDGTAEINGTLSGVTPTAAAHLTRKDYVDDNFVKISAEEDITGLKTFTQGVKIATATDGVLALIGNTTSDIAVTDFYLGAAQFGRIGTANTYLVNRWYHTAAGTNTEIKLLNDVITANKPISGITPTATAHLSTKGYVDDNFVADTGGTMSGDLTVGGTISATDAGIGVMTDKLRAYSTPNIFTVSPLFYSSSVITEFGTTNPMGTSTLVHKAYVDDNFAASAHNHDSLYYRKTAVDDNFVDITTTQDITGLKTFTNNVTVTRTDDTNVTLVIDAPVGRHPYLQLNADGVGRATLAAFSSNFFLGKQGGASLVLRATTIELDKPVEINNGDITGGEIALKERSSNGTNSVGIAAPDSVTSTYKMIMPSGPPSAGQSLEVASISGTLVYMQWV